MYPRQSFNIRYSHLSNPEPEVFAQAHVFKLSLLSYVFYMYLCITSFLKSLFPLKVFVEGGAECMSMHHLHAGVYRSQKAKDPLELELETFVSHLMCVMGKEHRSFARAACAFNCSVISNFHWGVHNSFFS